MSQPFPERIPGEGFALERWRPGDEALLGDLVARSREHLLPHMDFAREEPGPPEVHAALLRRWDEDWRCGHGVSYRVLDEHSAPSGTVSIHPESAPNALHVGYWLAPWATGRGLVTKSVAAICEIALARRGVDTVVIRHDAANERSAAVPRRLGFARTRAETRDASLPGLSRITVHWEATSAWRPPPGYSVAKIPTGHDTPVPSSPQ